eukprot:6339505-Amphidinium_carterae.2
MAQVAAHDSLTGISCSKNGLGTSVVAFDIYIIAVSLDLHDRTSLASSGNQVSGKNLVRTPRNTPKNEQPKK